MKLPDVFGREPALWLGVLAVVAQLVTTWVLPGSPEQQALINAAVVTVAGAITAYLVAQDQFVPAVLGVLQAAIALGIGFGLKIPAEQQALIMTAATSASAMFVRTQVVAPVSLSGSSGRHAIYDDA